MVTIPGEAVNCNKCCSVCAAGNKNTAAMGCRPDLGGLFVYTYNWYQWLLFFYIYCFFGWIFESTYVSICQKRLVNRGFLHSPMLPLYGSGAIIILFVSIPVKENWLLVYIFGALAATVLEYVTGVSMEFLFKVRYWDYSHKLLNFQGQICLTSTLAWGALSVLLTEFIHRPIETFVIDKIPELAAIIISCIVSAIFLADLVVSFRDAIKLRGILEKMTEVREEIEALQKRLGELSQEKLEQLDAIKEESFEWLTGLKDGGAERMAVRKRAAEEAFSNLSEDIREQLEQRIEHIKASYKSMKVRPYNVKYSILKRNPSAASKKFEAALNEYKKRVMEKKGK